MRFTFDTRCCSPTPLLHEAAQRRLAVPPAPRAVPAEVGCPQVKPGWGSCSAVSRHWGPRDASAHPPAVLWGAAATSPAGLSQPEAKPRDGGGARRALATEALASHPQGGTGPSECICEVKHLLGFVKLPD